MSYTFVLTGDARRHPGVHTHPTYGVSTYTGTSLPASLDESRAPSHSLEAFIETLINSPAPPHTNPGTAPMLTHGQEEVVGDIVTAQAAGLPGFILAYPTGSGKTVMAIETVNRLGLDRVLVIVPKRAISQWRATLDRFATGHTRWIVINPERLYSLFTLPGARGMHTLPYESRAELAYDIGSLLVSSFDMVITDEAHGFANGTTARTQLWMKVVGWHDNGARPDAFTLNMSATPWSAPRETVHSAHIIAHAVGAPVPDMYSVRTDYLSWLKSTLSLNHNLTGYREWSWHLNLSDVDVLARHIYAQGMGSAADRTSVGLPVQTRSLTRLTLSAKDYADTELLWAEFLAEYNPDVLAETGFDDIRESHVGKIQQIGKIKAPYVAHLVVDQLERGRQVVVPAWHHVVVDALEKAIEREAAARLGASPQRRVLSITGHDTATEQAVKVRGFQSGVFPVIITSTTQAINLHAGEVGGGLGGEDATTAERVTIFGDALAGGKRAFQAEGRATRQQTIAHAIYTVADNTMEEQALARIFRRLTNTRALTNQSVDAVMTDADIASFSALADALTPDPEKEVA